MTLRGQMMERSGCMPNSDQNTRLYQQIDRNLMRVYAETVQQEVPDRFRVLLEALRDKDISKGVKS